MPIWMGVRSSIAQRVIERLDGTTKTVMCEKTGQFPLYGSVCGCVVTGNEDGSHDCVANTFANLLHFGVTVPPNTDLYWVGDAGPGASFIEAGGELSPYVRRNAELTAQNLLFAAKLLRENPYPINIAEQNKIMMKRNEVKMQAMKLAVEHMRTNMPS
jgi:multimeric flavodoxin WrbA